MNEMKNIEHLKILNDGKIISDAEYQKLVARLDSDHVTRNNLLTFSFTVVLGTLGISVGLDEITPWICLIPFALIIPFAARIAYYRLSSAHINSFLKTFVPERMQFPIGTETVIEGSGITYRLISWLVNHEMVLLSVVTTIVFEFLFITKTPFQEWRPMEVIQCFIPIGLTLIVYFISHSMYSYKRLSENYDAQWRAYYKNCFGIESGRPKHCSKNKRKE